MAVVVRVPRRKPKAFLGLVVDREQVARLDELAAREGRSRSAIARIVLAAGLASLSAARGAAR